MFSWMSATWTLFNQVISLSSSPIGSFTSSNWVALKDLLMSVLTNPFFYWIIAIIVIMTILPTVEDD